MLRVIEVANKLGVSKVTIYKKIKKLDALKPYLVKKQKITYIQEEGINIIKNDLMKFKGVEAKTILNHKWDDEIKHLKDYKNLLEHQKSIKQSQLNNKEEQIKKIKYLIKLNKRRLELVKKQYNN